MSTVHKGKKQKVFVGLSGGVDSSVSAALLQKEGYDVVGVFIKVWQPDFLPCTWQEERRDAMRIAGLLKIPFLTFDFEEEYKRDVVDYMIAEYTAGRTPNPDVMCNRSIKFGAFFKKARSMGADFIATGHYAVIQKVGDAYALCQGADAEKDQSYFLWTLRGEQLPHVLFPVGHLKKTEVRRRAEEFGLPTAEKKDSQGLCFMGKLDMRDFLKHFIPEKEGLVLSPSGEVIGVHDGASYFTVGERRGFTVTPTSAQGEPHYIIKKDTVKNTLTVSAHPLHDGSIESVALEDVNWIREEPALSATYLARARYRQTRIPCRVEKREENFSVVFSTPQTGIAPGQSLVLYADREMLGGGIISHT